MSSYEATGPRGAGKNSRYSSSTSIGYHRKSLSILKMRRQIHTSTAFFIDWMLRSLALPSKRSSVNATLFQTAFILRVRSVLGYIQCPAKGTDA
jgi:hypothetical protein